MFMFMFMECIQAPIPFRLPRAVLRGLAAHVGLGTLSTHGLVEADMVL